MCSIIHNAMIRSQCIFSLEWGTGKPSGDKNKEQFPTVSGKKETHILIWRFPQMGVPSEMVCLWRKIPMKMDVSYMGTSISGTPQMGPFLGMILYSQWTNSYLNLPECIFQLLCRLNFGSHQNFAPRLNVEPSSFDHDGVAQLVLGNQLGTFRKCWVPSIINHHKPS